MKLEKDVEGDAMLEKLNTLWMGTYKLKVFIPRFDRSTTDKASHKLDNTSNSRSAISSYLKPAMSRFVERERSFASVVKGCVVTQKLPYSHSHSITFILTTEENEWLMDAKIGLLKNEFSWEEFGEEIQKEVHGQVVVKGLGEELILIKAKEEWDEGLGGLKEWEQYWFKWVREWRPKDVSQRRAIWTRWYGVPLYAWSERFFKQFSLYVGSFLEWDVKTKNQTNLDVARVKVWGYITKKINDAIDIAIEGKVFCIRICEEALCPEEDGDETSVCSSVESDTFPGRAEWEREESGLEDSADEGRGNDMRQIHEGNLEIEKGGGGTVDEGSRLGNGRVGDTIENVRMAAGWATCGSCGTRFCKDKCNGGSEESLEFLPGWGPPDRPTRIIEETAQIKSLMKAEGNSETGPKEIGSQEESLQYPPGWGPTTGNLRGKDTPVQSENEGPAQSKDQTVSQVQETSEGSLQFPPGWGPPARYKQGVCSKEDEMGLLSPTETNAVGNKME